MVFEPAPDGFEAFVIREVWDHIQLELLRARTNESIGLVAESACGDREGSYTLVCDAEIARASEYTSTAGHVEISVEAMTAVRGRLELTHPALEMLGWYHTHPDCESRFSYTDTLEQATWPSPRNVGLVGGGHPYYLLSYLYRGQGPEFIYAESTAQEAMQGVKAEASAR